MFNINICQWLDLNWWPLELEASTLPNEPQPLPQYCYLPSSAEVLNGGSSLDHWNKKATYSKQLLSLLREPLTNWLSLNVLLSFLNIKLGREGGRHPYCCLSVLLSIWAYLFSFIQLFHLRETVAAVKQSVPCSDHSEYFYLTYFRLRNTLRQIRKAK